MLVRRDGDGAIVIGQLSHAWIAGQLARAWGNPELGFGRPAEGVVLGAEQHDIGWATRDLEPPLDPETGLPESFMQSSVATHLGVWRTAPERLITQSALAALVVSLHGAYLSELRQQQAPPEHLDALRAHVRDERDRQAQLCAAFSISAQEREVIQRQMQAWDTISLALCCGWDPFTVRSVPSEDGPVDIEVGRIDDGTYTLDPWPLLRAPVEVRCEGRRLPSGYTDEAVMRRDLAASSPTPLVFVLKAR